MMMKLRRALKQISLFLSILFPILVVSCNRFTGELAVFDNDLESYNDIVNIRGILANYRAVMKDEDSLHSSQSSARLIRPVSAEFYDFYLYGQSGPNDTTRVFGPEQIYNISGTSGEFEFTVPRGLWYMTLVAVKHGDPFSKDIILSRKVKSTALLWGSCLSDYTNAAQDANFILTDESLLKEGSIATTITLDGWTEIPENIDKISCGLFYSKSGLLVEGTNETISFNTNLQSLFRANNKSLPSGTYTFKITFTNTKGTESLSDDDDFVWTDKIHIFPGRETDGDIFIPKVINEKPVSPENFAFALDSNPTDQSDYYSGTFTWKVPDSGTTATEYELRLYDEGSGKEYITYTCKNEGSILVRSGSLDSYSTSLQLWLPLGRKLSAQLRAKNRTGTSDEEWSSEKIENINLYRVTYNLQGGTLQNDSIFGEGTSGTKAAACRYGSIAEPHTWIKPGSNDIKDSDNKDFDYWSTSPEENAAELNTEENEGKYIGHENLELYANYKSDVTHPLKNEMGSLKLEYEYANTKYSIPDNGEISIPKGKNLRLYITPTGFIYNSMTIVNWKNVVNKFPYYDYNKWFYTELLTNGLSTGGPYQIKIEAHFTNTETGNDEISILIINLTITD